jgi:hypothetical protein
MGKKITLCILLILIIAAVVIQNIYVCSSTEELNSDLRNLQSALEKDDSISVRKAADTFYLNWEKEKKLFEAFFEHKEVDTISATAANIKSLCYSGLKEEALSYIAAEIFYIEHIRDIDAFGWENVF